MKSGPPNCVTIRAPFCIALILKCGVIESKTFQVNELCRDKFSAKLVIIVSSFVIFCSLANAVVGIDALFNCWHPSVRALRMGNTLVTGFTCPANIASTKGWDHSVVI